MTSRSRDNECYDYVIVGAGPSAMGLLYGLLVDHLPPFSICIVDQGDDSHDDTTGDPKDWYAASHIRSSKSVYQIFSTITNRVVDLPIGKGLGGTSNINATLCMPPLASDLESWPSPWKENLLIHVQEIQSVLKNNEVLQGAHGSCSNPSSFPFKEKSSLDIMTGVPTLATKSDGGTSSKFEYVRRNYFDGLVEPLLKNNPHLKDSVVFLLGSQVQRIIMDESNAAAKGLVYSSRNGELCTIHARKEVIVCAGAIESPILLQLSGVTLGGQVGLHLKDQVLIPRVFFATSMEYTKCKTVNGIRALGHWREGRDVLQVAILDTSTIQSIVPTTVAMAVRRNCNGFLFSQTWKRVFEFIYLVFKGLVSWTLWCMPVQRLVESYTVTTLVFLMHPVSEGSVRIRPRDNRESQDELMRRDVDITVNVNYLQDQKDIETLRRCWNSTCQDGRATEIFPRWMFQPVAQIFFSWNWFQGFCRLFSQPYYHFCCSCRMKTTGRDNWVVDSSLTVCNHSRLRVCDASVFPHTVSNPPALTCAALGYGLAKILVATVEKDKVCSK
ncbi:unnamed protein product [Cylindrotheca closterium]|uniref:Glucose-methanol-choline oxidoreductase N-terminal domain-containing protein n=1 Tax=Cylindrotheca closterium TaxID=2856 RepID=A0AAD2FII9_9STRA|nr:unnamed protein product [Cylindrotheca closterium]